MRFKLPQHILTLLISASYVIYLGSQEQLNLYIHPRYILFTITMALICFVLVIINSQSASSNATTHSHVKKESKLISMPLLFLLIVAVLLPASVLSSATVSQRASDTGSIVSTSESRSVSTLFASSSKGLRVSDWSRLLATNKDPSYYNNKPAKISGFVYDADLGDDAVWLARFVLTCCAVDAQPVGIPVAIPAWSDTYKQDTWVEVEGTFELVDTDQGAIITLVPDKIKQIDQPSNPYAN